MQRKWGEGEYTHAGRRQKWGRRIPNVRPGMGCWILEVLIYVHRPHLEAGGPDPKFRLLLALPRFHPFDDIPLPVRTHLHPGVRFIPFARVGIRNIFGQTIGDRLPRHSQGFGYRLLGPLFAPISTTAVDVSTL